MAKPNEPGMQNPNIANVTDTKMLEEASMSLLGDAATP